MFERFTRAAREAVVRAQVEARELHQSPIGTQHVLLALLADADGPIARALAPAGVDQRSVRAEIIRIAPPEAGPSATADRDAEDRAALRAIGIDLDAVRRAIEENFGPGALSLPTEQKKSRFFGRSGHLPFSPRSKKVLELSLREALRLKHNYIAPEHLMLGLLREGQGLAAQILAEREVDFARLRDELTQALNDKAA